MVSPTVPVNSLQHQTCAIVSRTYREVVYPNPKDSLNKVSTGSVTISHPNAWLPPMTQLSFSDAEYAGKRKQTRREKFLEEMEKVVPWKELMALLDPVYPKADNGRRPYALKTMLRVHLMQNWFGYSDPAMEEALYEVAPLRRFAGLSLVRGTVPDETTILNFRRMLETHALAPSILATVNAHLTDQGLLLRQGTIVDATIIHAPSSTKNAAKARDPQMHQTRKGNQWYFGMKAHIGVNVEGGLVHTVTTTAANVADVVEIGNLLHGKEKTVHADAGYIGADKRKGMTKRGRTWHIAAKRSRIKAMPEGELKNRRQGGRIHEGRSALESGTPLPRDQTPIRLPEGALQGTGQEHHTDSHAVRALEPVDGARKSVAQRRRGASMIG
jgi:IS5 family transposase